MDNLPTNGVVTIYVAGAAGGYGLGYGDIQPVISGGVGGTVRWRILFQLLLLLFYYCDYFTISVLPFLHLHLPL